MEDVGGGDWADDGVGAGAAMGGGAAPSDDEDQFGGIVEDGDESSDESFDSLDDEFDDGGLATAATLNVDDSGRRITAVGTLDLSPPEADLGEGNTPFDVAFHPVSDLVAVGCVSGRVAVLAYSQEANEVAVDLPVHEGSCRSLVFSPNDGQFLFTGGSDKTLRLLDLNQAGAVAFSQPDAHASAISCLLPYSEGQLFSGSDNGEVKLWDLRQRGPAFELSEHTDFISSFLPSPSKQRTLCLSGDGFLTSLDMRKGTVEAKSEEQDDELLSGAIMKNGQKVVVGTQEGILSIWSWGQWDDMTDRFPGHPHSIDALVKIDEDAICTGSSDGLIRLVSIQPNALMGVVGTHGDMPVERLRRSRDGKFLASVSHDTVVRFWDISYFDDDDDDGEEATEEALLAGQQQMLLQQQQGLLQPQQEQLPEGDAPSGGKADLDAPFFDGLL